MLVVFVVGDKLRAGDAERENLYVVADFGVERDGIISAVSDDELAAAFAVEGVGVILVEKRQRDLSGERENERRECGLVRVDIAKDGDEVVPIRERERGPTACNRHGSFRRVVGRGGESGEGAGRQNEAHERP